MSQHSAYPPPQEDPVSYPPPEPIRQGPSRGLVVGVFAAVFALAAVAYALVLTGTIGPAAPGASSANGATTGSSAGSPATSAGTSAGATEPLAPVKLPEDAKLCPPPAPELGPIAYAAAGTKSTSCDFAINVRTAYAASGAKPPAQIVVQATSPVTKKTYAMTCSGSQPVRCTGGNDAVVLLFSGVPNKVDD